MPCFGPGPVLGVGQSPWTQMLLNGAMTPLLGLVGASSKKTKPNDGIKRIILDKLKHCLYFDGIHFVR